MVKRTGPTNPNLQKLIRELKEKSLAEGTKLWKRLAHDLEKPTRQRRSVNLYKLEKHAKVGETIVVPGKVLSVGEITKKLNVAAFQFSNEANQKINKVGKTMTIQQLMKDNPKGSKVRILG